MIRQPYFPCPQSQFHHHQSRSQSQTRPHPVTYAQQQQQQLLPVTPPSRYDSDYDPALIVDMANSTPYFAPPSAGARSPASAAMDYMWGSKAEYDAPGGHGGSLIGASGGTFLSLRPEMATASVRPQPVLPPVVDPVLATPELYDPVGRRDSKTDMNMAKKGTVSARASFHTPLASYIAQLLVWMWFGRSSDRTRAPTPQTPSPLGSAYDLTQDPMTPINPLQLQPSKEFVKSVRRVLQLTLVSHSVTVVALLYVHRIKTQTQLGDLTLPAGSEWGVFVTSLILANKFLDDNTYTNRTWAELSGHPVKVINLMEAEFLAGLGYCLTVHKEEYERWSNLLDGFITSRERDAALRHSRLSYSPIHPHNPIFTPQSIPSAVLPADNGLYRARTASPPKKPHYNYAHAPDHQRKRSAVDAFAGDLPSTSTSAVMEQMRMPSRKAGFTVPVTPDYTQYSYAYPTAEPSQGSGLGRSTSLNRQIARMPPDSTGRRGSVGHVPTVPTPSGGTYVAQPQYYPWGPQFGDQYSALTAAFEAMQLPANVPPEHLVFYTVAADAHPGQDGAPRKGILHYAQNPYGQYPANVAQYLPPPESDSNPSAPNSLRPSPIAHYYPTTSQAGTPYGYAAQSPYMPDAVYPAPSQSQMQQQHDALVSMQRQHASQQHWNRTDNPPPATAVPAPFANAGPPAYAYNPWSNEDEGAYNEEEAIWSSNAEDAYLPSAVGGGLWSGASGNGLLGATAVQKPAGSTPIGLGMQTGGQWSSPAKAAARNVANAAAARFDEGYW